MGGTNQIIDTGELPEITTIRFSDKPHIRFFKTCLALLTVLLLSACLPSGNKDVNTELFRDKEDMKERALSLKAGMAKKQVFDRLQIEPDRFMRMSQQDVQLCIYGNSQVQGTPEQLEQFRERLARYEGYSLPYSEIKSSRSLGFGTVKVERTGYDLKLILIFDRERLIKVQIEGTQEVKQNDDQYIWDILLNKGVGMAL